MKKIIIVITIILNIMLLTACKNMQQQVTTTQQTTTTEALSAVDQAILAEEKASFDFFWNEANTNSQSSGYGLINDRAPSNPNLASVASVGFGLTAIPIGITNGWITREEGAERVLGTLETFENLYNNNGFYYHFLNKSTGARSGSSEISIVDTGLFITGALFAGEYFGGEIQEKANELYAKINWNWFVDPSNNMYYMSYNPGTSSFAGHWDFYAEQLILYVLGAGSPNPDYRINESVYDSFHRRVASYGSGESFISSWFGSLFTYQYSLAWLDFRNIDDKNGVNWFENSVNATIANRQYAIDNSDIFKTFGDDSWGMSACDGPNGYSGYYGSKPSGYTDDAHHNDGTIPPSGSIGSIVFLPDEVKDAITYFETIDGLKGEYGYYDAYNLEGNTPWIDKDVIGIDKGITLLMIQNYRNQFVWNTFMQNEYVQNGLSNLEFSSISE